MAVNQLYCLITMKAASSGYKESSFTFFGLVEFFLIGFFRWVSSTQRFFSRLWSLLQPEHFFERKNHDLELSSQQSSIPEKKHEDELLRREDVELVMKSLGLFCGPESEKLQERYSSDELSRLFEEKEPSFEEVKEAFDVFDENKDGFIDATELQRVLSILGLKEGSNLENCQKMIRSFDGNKDGRIDFHEFVKFMETSLC